MARYYKKEEKRKRKRKYYPHKAYFRKKEQPASPFGSAPEDITDVEFQEPFSEQAREALKRTGKAIGKGTREAGRQIAAAGEGFKEGFSRTSETPTERTQKVSRGLGRTVREVGSFVSRLQLRQPEPSQPYPETRTPYSSRARTPYSSREQPSSSGVISGLKHGDYWWGGEGSIPSVGSQEPQTQPRQQRAHIPRSALGKYEQYMLVKLLHQSYPDIYSYLWTEDITYSHLVGGLREEFFPVYDELLREVRSESS